MKLTKSQIEVLTLMNEGWALCASGDLDASAWLQKDGCGCGGPTKRVNVATKRALFIRGLINRKYGFPTTTYYLSQKGIEVLREVQDEKLLRENIHIDVEPADGYDRSEQGIINICKGIKEQILRHIDDVADVAITWEDHFVCSFCGFDWETNENPLDPDWELGEPVCCTAAQEEWGKMKEKK